MNRDVCEHFNPVDQPCAKCEEKRKSEALFLADELEIPLGTVIQSEVCRRAAKELRRLHAELERCKQVCAATSEAWREEAALAEPVQEPGDFDHAIGADRFKVVRGAFWWHVLIGDSPTEHGKFRSRASAEKMAADLLREFRNGAFVQHEAALAEPCPCGDRPAAQCLGEWEPGCDLGNNPKYAKRVEMTPKELAASIKRGEKWKVAESVQEPVQEHENWCASVTQLLLCDPPRKAPCNCKKKVAEPVQEPPEFPPHDDKVHAGAIYWYVGTDGKYYSSNEVKLFMETKNKSLHYEPPKWVLDNFDLIPLYTAPPQRKPLSDVDLAKIWDDALDQLDPRDQLRFVARAIERAHGIGEQQ